MGDSLPPSGFCSKSRTEPIPCMRSWGQILEISDGAHPVHAQLGQICLPVYTRDSHFNKETARMPGNQKVGRLPFKAKVAIAVDSKFLRVCAGIRPGHAYVRCAGPQMPGKQKVGRLLKRKIGHSHICPGAKHERKKKKSWKIGYWANRSV